MMDFTVEVVLIVEFCNDVLTGRREGFVQPEPVMVEDTLSVVICQDNTVVSFGDVM